MKVLLITGFLGAGKTTLLNRILSNRQGIRFAVVVNDLGEVNIDADLIRRNAVAGLDEEGQLVALENGCICCTLKADLQRQILSLAKGPYDYIVIEASGVCTPQPIANAISALRHMSGDFPDVKDAPRLDCITTVVDALRLREEFGLGTDLPSAEARRSDPLTNLLAAQIEFANIILLNKVEEVNEEERDTLIQILHTLIPAAHIIPCSYCDVPLDTILNTGLFHFDQLASAARWVSEMERPLKLSPQGLSFFPHATSTQTSRRDHTPISHANQEKHPDHAHAHDLGITSFTYYRRRPFSLARFDEFLAEHWPREVIRCKGLLYFAENPDYSYLFEQAGPQRQLQEAGLWYASAPKEQLDMMLAQNPALAADWDPEYGDRMIKLVFIGRHLDAEHLVALLDEL